MARKRRPRLTTRLGSKVTAGLPGGKPHVVGAQPFDLTPPGSYDPALDAQERATQRGLTDLLADFGRDYGDTGAGGRAFNDYTLDVEDITRAVQQGRQDFDTQRGDIGLGYQRLGRKQAEGARAQGVLSQGLAALSAQKRTENQGRDVGRVNTAEDRAFGLDRSQIGGEAGRRLGRLSLGYGRQTEDALTGRERAVREGTQFSIDTDASRRFQAQTAGMLGSPPLARGPARTPARPKPRRKRGRGTLVGTVGRGQTGGL